MNKSNHYECLIGKQCILYPVDIFNTIIPANFCGKCQVTQWTAVVCFLQVRDKQRAEGNGVGEGMSEGQCALIAGAGGSGNMFDLFSFLSSFPREVLWKQKKPAKSKVGLLKIFMRQSKD